MLFCVLIQVACLLHVFCDSWHTVIFNVLAAVPAASTIKGVHGLVRLVLMKILGRTGITLL